MSLIKSFGRLDWSKPVDPEKLQLDQAALWGAKIRRAWDSSYCV